LELTSEWPPLPLPPPLPIGIHWIQAIHKYNCTPNMTPYCSGLPIDFMPPPDPKNPNLKQRTKFY
jgi:hypothetical protein